MKEMFPILPFKTVFESRTFSSLLSFSLLPLTHTLTLLSAVGELRAYHDFEKERKEKRRLEGLGKSMLATASMADLWNTPTSRSSADLLASNPHSAHKSPSASWMSSALAAT